MNSATAGKVPKFGVAAALLKKTTEQLAGELSRPSERAPPWNSLEWTVARASAAIQGISVLLGNRLRWAGPPEWRSFLEEQKLQSVARHARIGSLLQLIDQSFRDGGIAAVALKGAALYRLPLYAPGERPMGDVDLLVRSREMQAVGQVLNRIGYQKVLVTARHEVYAPQGKSMVTGLGEHVENPLKIEIHSVVAEPLPISKVDITELVDSDHPDPGLNPYPRPSALLLHLLLHAAGNMRAHVLRQIQLHDIASLALRMRDQDWSEVLDEPGRRNRRWWIYPPLALTSRYYAGSIDPGVLLAARSSCPRLLRYCVDRQSLTEVSWSNLRIHAFPGMSWSRTPVEALRFARSRVVPHRERVGELNRAIEVDQRLGTLPWYGVSHPARIARWIFLRPPRVQTALSLRAAFDSVRQPEGLVSLARADR